MLHVDDPDASLTAATASSAFAVWMQFEPDRDYYRLVHPATKTLAVHDRLTGDSFWFNRSKDETIELGRIEAAGAPWQPNLNVLLELAVRLDATRTAA
jgi:hypothetical protein